MINPKLRALKNPVFKRSHPEEGCESRRRILCGNVSRLEFLGFRIYPFIDGGFNCRIIYIKPETKAVN